MHYFIQTFGCQANTSDSERIAGDYQSRGFSPIEDWKLADEIVINTCSVRQSAEDRVRGLLYNIDQYFVGKTKPKIILTGCITHFSNDKLLTMFPMIDEVLPIAEVGFSIPAIRKDLHHAFVPISTGCNSFCTYCIVPYSRGREASRPLDDIVSEVQTLANQGYREITLLGQNVNSYGLEKVGIAVRKSDFNLPTNQSQYHKAKGIPPFVKLLQAVSAIPQIKIIRFMTSNPWDFHDELIEEIAHNPKIDRYLHLPIQSGCDRILKLMNRGYTTDNYSQLVSKIRQQIPGVVIGTDIIVGFPTETEADFNQTLNFAKTMNWKVAFVARYSPRPGTVSSQLYPDDVSPAEKKRRWEVLDQILNKDTMAERPNVVS